MKSHFAFNLVFCKIVIFLHLKIEKSVKRFSSRIFTFDSEFTQAHILNVHVVFLITRWIAYERKCIQIREARLREGFSSESLW